jgi:hypothetical protein
MRSVLIDVAFTKVTQIPHVGIYKSVEIKVTGDIYKSVLPLSQKE